MICSDVQCENYGFELWFSPDPETQRMYEFGLG
jgi:hypothetical protein